MAYKKGTKDFFAEVDKPVRVAFQRQWKERGQGNNEAATAALRLWISLPREVQAIVLHFQAADVQRICESVGNQLQERLSNALAREIQSGKISGEIDSKDKK